MNQIRKAREEARQLHVHLREKHKHDVSSSNGVGGGGGAPASSASASSSAAGSGAWNEVEVSDHAAVIPSLLRFLHGLMVDYHAAFHSGGACPRHSHAPAWHADDEALACG